MSRCLVFALCLCAALAQPPATTDDAIWNDFAKWVDSLAPLPPSQRISLEAAYVQRQVKKGIAADQATGQFERILLIRRGSADRERVYWNGAFKLGGGPSNPARLLQESLRGVKPGKALDAGMGRGRNALYLASVGWEVTGYDMAEDAVKAAQSDAVEAKVSVKTVVAKHDDFEFGENKYDLIVCLYNYMTPSDPKWPDVFWRALRPGGIVVWQTSWNRGMGLPELLKLWGRFRVVRYEDLDAGVVDDDWRPSLTNPTVKLVVRKE